MPPRKIFSLVTVNAAAVLALFFLGEVAARQMGFLPMQYVKSTAVDSSGTIVSQPLQSIRYHYQSFARDPFTSSATETHSYEIIIDSVGKRVPPPPSPPPKKHTHKLAVIGDSFSFGAHASYEDSLAGILEQNLTNTNVYNYGVNGASSYDYPEILKYFIREDAILPQYLVVGLYTDLQMGDLPRRIARDKFGNYKALHGISIGPFEYSELIGSPLYYAKFLAELFIRSNSSIANTLWPQSRLPEFSFSIKSRKWDRLLSIYSKYLQRTMKELQLISGLGAEKILIWLIPSNHEVNNKLCPACFTPEESKLHAFSKKFWSQLTDELGAKGHPVIDPREKIYEFIKTTNQYPFATDGHLLAEGYQEIAKPIVHALKRPNSEL